MPQVGFPVRIRSAGFGRRLFLSLISHWKASCFAVVNEPRDLQKRTRNTEPEK